MNPGWSLAPALLKQVPFCPAQPERERERQPQQEDSGGSFKLPPTHLNATSLRKSTLNRTKVLHPSKPFFSLFFFFFGQTLLFRQSSSCQSGTLRSWDPFQSFRLYQPLQCVPPELGGSEAGEGDGPSSRGSAA